MIEKILERLEEEKQRLRKMRNTCIALSDKEVCDIEEKAYNFCKEIVQEVAKEYGKDTNVRSNGWIPCSERLPEIYEDSKTSDTVLVCTVDGFQHMAFFCSDNKWRYCESGMIGESMEWTEIVAWQPLPAPYQKGE